MSRVGKKPIEIPDKVEVSLEEDMLKAKGPLGELSLELPDVVKVTKDEDSITVELARVNAKNKPFWGLYRALIANILQGVSSGFEKQLEIEGVGYRAETKGNELVLNLGYSHPVVMEIPEDIKIQVEKSLITVSGIDKQKVGQMAADIRSKRKPEPYKGKGIRYKGEHIRRKAGKRAIAGGGA